MGIKTMAKKEYRKFREYEEDYFRKNPDEIDDYLKEVFDEYAEDGNTPALLSSLRVISRVKGISEISRETGITRNGIQKALSEEGNPRLESINAIMHAMGSGSNRKNCNYRELSTFSSIRFEDVAYL